MSYAPEGILKAETGREKSWFDSSHVPLAKAHPWRPNPPALDRPRICGCHVAFEAPGAWVAMRSLETRMQHASRRQGTVRVRQSVQSRSRGGGPRRQARLRVLWNVVCWWVWPLGSFLKSYSDPSSFYFLPGIEAGLRIEATYQRWSDKEPGSLTMRRARAHVPTSILPLWQRK